MAVPVKKRQHNIILQPGHIMILPD
jgi:hypothetical protein